MNSNHTLHGLLEFLLGRIWTWPGVAGVLRHHGGADWSLRSLHNCCSHRGAPGSRRMRKTTPSTRNTSATVRAARLRTGWCSSARVFVGGFLSGVLAHRLKLTWENRGLASTTPPSIWLLHLWAGGLMGIGAKRSLSAVPAVRHSTGGALLNVGSWAFMWLRLWRRLCELAYFVRKQWI